jgi:hypothetical protein
MVVQAKIYTMKTCIMENVEKGYADRNIDILTDSQATFKAHDSFHMYRRLI